MFVVGIVVCGAVGDGWLVEGGAEAFFESVVFVSG